MYIVAINANWMDAADVEVCLSLAEVWQLAEMWVDDRDWDDGYVIVDADGEIVISEMP